MPRTAAGSQAGPCYSQGPVCYVRAILHTGEPVARVAAIMGTMTAAEHTDDSSWLRAMRFTAGICAVLVVLAVCPYTPDWAVGIKYLMLSWDVVVLALIRLMEAWGSDGRLHRPSPLAWLLLAFLALNLAAAVHSSYVVNSLFEFRKFVALALLYVMVAHAVRTPEQGWRLMAVVCVAVALASLYGFCQKFGLDPFPWGQRYGLEWDDVGLKGGIANVLEYRNLPSTFGNPNLASHVLSLGLIMAVGLGFRRQTRWCLVLAAAIALHLHFTHVRAARLAVPAAAALVGIAILVGRGIKKPSRALATVCLVFGLLSVAAGGGVMAYSKARTGSWLPVDNSLLLRYNAYAGACRMIQDRPWLGFGPGNYWLENPPYWTPHEQESFATTRRFNQNVHNDFLEAGVEAGAGGASLYMAFLACAALSSLAMGLKSGDTARRRLAFTLAACFAAFAIDGVFGFNLRVPASATVLFLLAGVFDGVWRQPAREGAPARRPATLAVLGSIYFIALLVAVLETWVFAGQLVYQRAHEAKAAGDAEKAYAHFRLGQRLIPWEAKFPEYLAQVDAEQGRLDAAIRNRHRALALRPDYVMYEAALARAYFDQALTQPDTAQKSFARAESHAQRALDLCPALPEAHDSLGRCMMARARALERNPESAGKTAEAAWREARGHFQEALVYGAENRSRLHRLVADTWLAVGAVEAAGEAYQRAAEAEPESQETWDAFFGFAAAHGDWERLLDALNAAREREGGSGQRLDLLEAINRARAAMNATAPE
jgi:tetratricopeptide (TPR) repeat protein